MSSKDCFFTKADRSARWCCWNKPSCYARSVLCSQLEQVYKKNLTPCRLRASKAKAVASPASCARLFKQALLDSQRCPALPASLLATGSRRNVGVDVFSKASSQLARSMTWGPPSKPPISQPKLPSLLNAVVCISWHSRLHWHCSFHCASKAVCCPQVCLVCGLPASGQSYKSSVFELKQDTANLPKAFSNYNLYFSSYLNVAAALSAGVTE